MTTWISSGTAACALALSCLLSATSSCADQPPSARLRILETTDIHANALDYDFYKDAPTTRFGLVRTANLIHQARAEEQNVLLVDNGDLLQGSPMGDWQAAQGLQPDGRAHSVYQIMNALGYDLGTLGNHDFNYGLDYQKTALAGARFPVICSNVLNTATGKPLIKPWLLKTMQIKDSTGREHALKVGFLGFVPPQIMEWDHRHLAGKIKVQDIIKTARTLVPRLKEEGAEVIVVLAHSGLGSTPYHPMAENTVYNLSTVPGIDAIAFGHSHSVFPSDDYANLAGVDSARGTINGVPAVMAGRWGSHLGVIDLTLEQRRNRWHVVQGRAQARPIMTADGTPLVEADHALAKKLADEKARTRAFLDVEVGRSDTPLYSFLSLVQDDATTQIVNQAQIDYVQKLSENKPELQGLPILAAAAPFKAGGRHNNPENYTTVEEGVLTRRNVSDLYLYPNTLVVLKVTGSDVKEWLERSAGLFNQIDIHSSRPQQLINWAQFRTYNFDVIDGVSYSIDVSQPSRYDGDGKLIHPAAHRIKQLRWKGKPVRADQSFLLATNNYRAWGGGHFPGTGETRVLVAAPDETRQILADYVARVSKAQGQVRTSADHNWKLAPLHTKTRLDVRFETAPSTLAADFIKKHALHPVQTVGTDKEGFALYRIDLTQG